LIEHAAGAASISPRARCRMAADRMPFADDVTTIDSTPIWRSSVQDVDGGVTSSPTGHVDSTPAAGKLWSLPNSRRQRVVNALKGTVVYSLIHKFKSFDLIHTCAVYVRKKYYFTKMSKARFVRKIVLTHWCPNYFYHLPLN